MLQLYALSLENHLFLERILGILANSNENYRRYNFQAFANISGNFRKIPGNFRTTVIICRLIVGLILTKLGQCVLFLFLLKFTLLDLFTIFITAHGKVSFASGVYAMGGISVCLSVSGVISRGTRGNAVPIVKVFKNAQGRNAAVKDKQTFIAQSSTLAFTSLLPSLQTTPFAKNNWKLAFNNSL